jgi:hypothetical protein
MRCLFALAMLVVLAPVASARRHHLHPLRIRIEDQARSVSRDDLNAIVGAVQEQLDRDFRQYYLVSRPIELSVGRGHGWRVIVTDKPLHIGKVTVAGYHDLNAAGIPFARVGTSEGSTSWVMSHEIMEMVTDPLCDKHEICDGLKSRYDINGLPVSDFRLPKGSAAANFCATVDFCY